LTPDIPDVELKAAMLERFDVEAKGGRNLRDVLPVELLQDSRLARVVQT
jgi:hypothetical protein